jgi:hypothetical protein
MSVYHVQLRKFPKAAMRFNQSGQQVGAIVLPWVQERIVEVDDSKWSPHDATLTIIEGDSIPIEGISMGRGWRTAQREGEDVTERILAEARQALADGSAPAGSAPGVAAPPSAAEPQSPAQAPPGPAAASTGAPAEAQSPTQAPSGADQLALGVELGGLLGPDASRLLSAWREVASRSSGLAPSESLALAERELREEPRGPG